MDLVHPCLPIPSLNIAQAQTKESEEFWLPPWYTPLCGYYEAHKQFSNQHGVKMAERQSTLTGQSFLVKSTPWVELLFLYLTAVISLGALPFSTQSTIAAMTVDR
jgi:hypothetical protein